MEALLVATISPLLGGRFYPDAAPHNTPLPYGTYQQVGGQVVAVLEGGPSATRNGRLQINVWHGTRLAANALMRQVEDALQGSPFYGEPIGALIARREAEAELGLYGAQQDFSLWWST